MSATASILYLRLDEDYDPVFDPGAELSNLDAVAQAIKTRLLLFQGEWWENLNEGTPMFQEIIGRRATGGQLQIMSLALTQRVAGTPYVSSVQNAEIKYDPFTRALSFSCIAQTSFGEVPVTFTPGLAASVA